MAKLKIGDLAAIKEKVRREAMLRDGEGARARINVHMGTCGIASGARDILGAVLAEIEEKEIKDVIVSTSGCAGLCSREPMATVEVVKQAPVKYVDLTPEKIVKILHEHVLGGNIVEEYSFSTGSERVG